jgi:hypothetical protein
MRIILSVVAIGMVSGCAGIQGSQHADHGSGGSPDATPVVIEQPLLSERLRYSRQHEAAQAVMGQAEVSGVIKQ